MRLGYLMGLAAILVAGAVQAFTLQSPNFTAGSAIPKQFTCQGGNIAPGLQWSDIPPNTEAFALIVRDPDATNKNAIHWVLYNIAVGTTNFPQGFDPKAAGILVGKNTWNGSTYHGPCPPTGSIHDYRFELYALDRALYVESGLTAQELEAAMNTHILGMATLVGTYKLQ